VTSSAIVLITGAARRIGACLATTMHSSGCRVLLHCHHSSDQAEALCAALNTARPNSAAVLVADLCRNDQIEQLAQHAMAHWGQLDALINNASDFYPTPLATASENDWDRLIGSNLKGPYFLCLAVAEELRRRHGVIVNIADIYARQPLADHSIYCIAKAGNVMMTRTLAKELAPEVRVNGIAPGAILWADNLEKDHQNNQLGKNKILEKIPLNRLGSPEDIARIAAFLITKGSYITGQTIAVDGGRSA